MRRLPNRVTALVLIVAGLLALIAADGRDGRAPTASGQEATPGGASPEAQRSGTPLIERLSCGDESFAAVGTPDAAARAWLELNVVTFAPGDAIATTTYRQPVAAYVLFGEVELSVVGVEPDGRVWLRTAEERRNEAHPWQCTVHEVLGPGTVTILGPGDAVFLERADYAIRNPSSGNAVLMTSVIDDLDDEQTCRGGCPTWP